MNDTQITIDSTHPSLSGHFPGEPIVPGAILLDHAIAYIEHAFGRRVALISAAKFLIPVKPQQAVVFNISRNGDDRVTVTGTVEDATVLSLSIMLQKQDAR